MKRGLLAVIGILALLLGLLPGSVFAAAPASAQVIVTIFGPTQGKIGALSATMAEAGGIPNLDQITKINRLQA